MKIINLEKISSTQDYLKNIIKKCKNEEIFVFAEEQTKGKGRGENKFYSPKGGIYLSFHIPDIKDEKHIFLIPCVSSFMLINEVLRNFDLKPYIRIPNDIIVKDKKVCGILIERTEDKFICGIGINVNTKKFPEYLKEASSLSLLTGETFEIEKLKTNLIGKIINYSKKEKKFLYNIYKKNIPLKKEVEFQFEDKMYKGILNEIKENFIIEIDLKDKLRCFPLFEIFNLRIKNG